VDVLNQQCLRFLQMRKEATAKEPSPIMAQQMACCSVSDVLKFISELGISKIKLDEDDLETILKTVVYDGKAERIAQAAGKFKYRAISSPLAPPGLIQMPCGICPVIQNCSDCGKITPKLCVYMNEWLD
jgi:DNA-directed RNA polymerase III subunit RPC6